MPSRPVHNIVSPYLAYLLAPLKLRQIVNNAIRTLPKKKFDSIAFRGMSGAIVAPIIAMKLKKNLIMVRKNGEETHSLSKVEGFSRSKRYIIVDDFIESGETAANIYFEVKDFAPKAECIGLLVVCDGRNGNEPLFHTLNYIRKRFSYKWSLVNKENKLEKANKKARVAKLRAARRKVKSKE
jgi:hypoxanthine phosphoribosyltransferase